MPPKSVAQRDFAAEYRRKFPTGTQYDKGASSGADVRDDWCLGFGFALRTVQRWSKGIAVDCDPSADQAARLRARPSSSRGGGVFIWQYRFGTAR
jgi:hypothetical protein